jgi:hypothetical protein
MASPLALVERDCLGITSAYAQRVYPEVLDAAERAMARVLEAVRSVEAPKYVGQGNPLPHTPLPQPLLTSPAFVAALNGDTAALAAAALFLVAPVLAEPEMEEGWEEWARAWLPAPKASDGVGGGGGGPTTMTPAADAALPGASASRVYHDEEEDMSGMSMSFGALGGGGGGGGPTPIPRPEPRTALDASSASGRGHAISASPPQGIVEDDGDMEFGTP